MSAQRDSHYSNRDSHVTLAVPRAQQTGYCEWRERVRKVLLRESLAVCQHVQVAALALLAVCIPSTR